MNTKELKYELINKIINLTDIQILSQIDEILKQTKPPLAKENKRYEGCGKGIFTSISNDFNKPFNFQLYYPVFHHINHLLIS